MCGIAGVGGSAGSDELGEIARQMAAAIRHRGPDADGQWVSPAGDCAFAHRRLSIIDLSTAGNQPMVSPGGRYVVCYNGEIYNYQALRAQLAGDGRAFVSTSDTEVLLAAIERWGLDGALSRCVGMFAFALWDREDGSVHLVRDRLGVKPLYYAIDSGRWAFASEIKALEQCDGLDFTLNRRAASLYLRYGYIPSPHSIYRGIRKVPPGSIVRIDTARSNAVARTWWDLPSVVERAREDAAPISAEDAVEELAERLDEAVRLRMIADVPVGAFLSGGIDSSTVVALMRRHTAREIRTFTIGFHETKMDEATYAKQVAAHLGTQHHEQYIDRNDLLGCIDDIASIGDEPFADASILPTYLLSRLAAQEVKVVLSGDGGDEFFAGYTHYARAPSELAAATRLPAPARRLIGGALMSLNSGAGKLPRKGAMAAARDTETFCQGLLSHWQRPSLILRDGVDDDDPWPDRAVAPNQDVSEYLMLRDAARYLPDDILHKVDRASMAVSLEARNPLLDHRVVEFAWRLPYALKHRDGQAKWPLRQLLGRHVPRELFERPKQGFGVPISAWLDGELRDWAEDLLHGRAANEIFHGERLRAIWRKRTKKKRRRGGSHLWDVLMFLQWIERGRATW